jgi:deazaflavin-dependent oxidoreductase (nitroreductase family)
MARAYRLGPARRAVNTLVSVMLKAGIGGRSYYLLTTVGRVSGQQRTTPVIVVHSGDERWLVSPYGQVGWVRNVRTHPVVSLRRGRRTEVLRAVEASPQAAAPVLQHYVRSVRVTAPFFDAKGTDPVERFVEEAGRHPVFMLAEDTAA